MSDKVVHIGYPKAGSSFLQMHIFPHLKGFEVIDYSRGKTFSHYLMNSGMFFKPEKAVEIISSMSEKFILTDEVLIGNPIKGIGINDESTPKKLKQCGFNKVIISLRRDKDKWVKSLYNEFLKLGGKLSFEDFLANPAKHNSEYSWYNPAMIEYSHEYVQYYKDIFGPENVLVLYIEDVKIKQHEFVSRLLSFLGSNDVIIPGEAINESMTPGMQAIIRFFNNFTSSRMSPSTLFRWFSTARVTRLLQMFSKKSITKYR
jgi:hypothetical protein